MERRPVQSSRIASIGFDPATQTLEIEFISGKRNRVYQYEKVPAWLYDDFMDDQIATSKGRFFEKVIKGYYKYKEIKDDRRD